MLVTVGDGGRRTEIVRALLDPCSESTLVTLAITRRLGRSTTRVNVGITGVSSRPMDSARVRVRLHLHPPRTTAPLQFEALGLKALNVTTPASSFQLHDNQIQRLTLADPKFNTPA